MGACLAVEPGKQRFGRRSGPWRHRGELRRSRLSPPLSAGDLQPRAPQPRFSRRRLRGFRLVDEAASQLPISARFNASREAPESLEERHLSAALAQCPLMTATRKFGWTGLPEEFACQFRRRRCLSSV